MSYDKAISQLKNSVSRPTLYKLQMPGRFIGRDTNDYLEYFCNAAQIPSVRFQNIQVQGHSEQGITRLQPTFPVWTNPLTVSIIENSDFTVYRDLKGWINDVGQGVDQQGQRSVKIKYFNQITGDIELTKLEHPDGVDEGQLKESMKVTFLNAYIKGINVLSFDSSQANQFLTYTVDFNYESYTTEE